MPDYANAVISDAYKSYFIEVEPGIKIHVLEVGQGYPVYLQHGNPTTGLLYRKVAASLPLDRVRLIMPTMVGLGYSTKIPASEHTLDNHMRWMNRALTNDLTECVCRSGLGRASGYGRPVSVTGDTERRRCDEYRI